MQTWERNLEQRPYCELLFHVYQGSPVISGPMLYLQPYVASLLQGFMAMQCVILSNLTLQFY